MPKSTSKKYKVSGKTIVGGFSDRTYTPQDRTLYTQVNKKSRRVKKPRIAKMVKSLRGLQDLDNNNPAKGGFGIG